jgi:hypothetical protein
MRYLQNAIDILNNDLSDKKKIDVMIKLYGNEFDVVKISNYYAAYQTESADLILVETGLDTFVVSRWDANFSIKEQIINAINN